MTFAHPQILWMLAVVPPALGLFFWWSWRVRRRLIDQFLPRRLQESLTIGVSPRRVRGRAWLIIGAIAALLVALARPRLGAGSIQVHQRGLDILIGIDTSRSMLAEDAGPGISRLRRAKLAAFDLAQLAHNDRLGLIAFAGTAFLQCPLTVDEVAFRQSVDALDTETIPQGGTSLGSAIQTALDTFKNEQDNVRVLVLFTDGEEHDSGAVDAAKGAAAKGLRVFTVGVGTTRGEIIRLRDPEGKESYLKDTEGNVVKSSLNESLLQEIARTTGGFYLPLQGPRAMSELFTRGLQPLPRTDLSSRTLEQFQERFQWPLAVAIVLLAIETLVPERARIRGPVRAFRLPHPKLGASVTAALVALALVPINAMASPRSALRDYRKGDYQAAEGEYERLAKEHPDDSRLRFNAGTAAFRAEDFQRAIVHLGETLRTPDLRLQHDAYYNLGNAQFSQGEELPDPAARRPLWEQSVQSFESALKLSPQDANARHNLDFVRQRLEELKQQQKQQQQQKDKQQDSKDKNDKQDKQDNSDKSDKQDDKDKQQDDAQKKQDSSKDSKDSPSPSDQQKKDDGKDEPKPQDNPQGSDKDDSQSKPQGDKQASKSPKDGQSPKDGSDGSASPAEQQAASQMTPQQALRLLDSTKGDEKPIPLAKRRGRARIVKDW